MANTYGILLGDTHYTYKKAESAKQLVAPYLRKVIEDMEGITIPPGELKKAVQDFVNGYGEVTMENQLSDHGKIDYTIVTYGEVADHLMNQGWITENSRSIDNRLQARMIEEWMAEKGIQDYEYTQTTEDAKA